MEKFNSALSELLTLLSKRLTRRLAPVSELNIKKMQEEDVTALYDVFKSPLWNKSLEQYQRYYREQVNGKRIIFVARVDSRCVGYVTILLGAAYPPFQEQGVPEIQDLNVLHEFRKKGIATALLLTAEDECRKLGKYKVGLGVGLTPDYGNAQKLYPKLGYLPDGRGVTPENELMFTKILYRHAAQQSRSPKDKTWFAIDGRLEHIDFPSGSWFRFPEEFAARIIERFSKAGDWIFDPFSGFGTTQVAAEKVGRHAIGFEKEIDRFQFTQKRIQAPSKIIHDNIFHWENHQLPKSDLLFTSPPYGSFREWDAAGMAHYWEDFTNLFSGFQEVLKPTAKIVVELCNRRLENGDIQTLAWDAAKILSSIYKFRGEIIRCNTGPEIAGPGYDHSYLMVFDAK